MKKSLFIIHKIDKTKIRTLEYCNNKYGVAE